MEAMSKLTPEQRAALEIAQSKRSGNAPKDYEAVFAAGIAHGVKEERERCAKVCREWAAASMGSNEFSDAANACADAIESPAAPAAQPK
jgi:hypothetical protein